MTQFTVQRGTSISPEERERIKALPGFAAHLTEHMAVADFDDERGWHDLAVRPVEPFSMRPDAGVLHYAQEIFEGMKAYRHADDSVWLFRPEMNAARFERSAKRMAMAPVPQDLFLDAVFSYMATDIEWVPNPQGERTVYVRPFEFANEDFLGVREAKEYRFCVIGGPAGAYYPDPVRLWATPNYTRAAPGGTGAAKCGGNYAASLIAAKEAKEHDCQQVIWLDGAEHRYVEECGTMNILFVTRSGELLTPSLTGSILEGVTRDSLLALAPEHGLKPVERRIEIDEVFEGAQSGEITECFACGTAAVITPVIGLKQADRDVDFGTGRAGEHTMELRKHLLGIQFGDVEDKHGWLKRVDG